jgi:hypothetical protein
MAKVMRVGCNHLRKFKLKKELQGLNSNVWRPERYRGD